MTRLAILEYPHPHLRQSAEPVTNFDRDLARLADDLLETLYASGGIGLCAPQVGDSRQVLVMDLSGRASEPQVYVNPCILAGAELGLVEESCLSVPGVIGNVVRNTKVRVRAQDLSGGLLERDLEGMHAVCLQHESDHLAGKLFIDHLSILRRIRIRLLANSRARGGKSPADRRQSAV
jgi:peptide deformylase